MTLLLLSLTKVGCLKNRLKTIFNSLNLVLLGLLFIAFPTTNAEETITLQLKWQHQFQFAGYYAAHAKGYYKDVGLNVNLIAANPNTNVVDEVLSGHANYGVGSNDLLLDFHKGKSVIVLAVIFQHSPYVLLSKASDKIKTVHDLPNKRIMLEEHSEELIAYMKKEGIALESIKLVPHNFNAQALIDDEVDAMSAYQTDEPFALKQAGIAYQEYSPRSVGIDFYGDNLFTTQANVKNNPEQIKVFREASMKGWEYALKNPEEIISLILENYDTTKNREQLSFEAEKMMSLIHPELIELGYMLPGRWQHIANTYAELGMLPDDIVLNDFLYQPKGLNTVTPTKTYAFVFIAIAVIVLITLIALRLKKLNKMFLQLLYIKNRHANIGETIDSVTHQWKQPLNTLSILIMKIQMLRTEETIDKDELLTLTNKCNDNIEVMSQSLDVFRKQFDTKLSENQFIPATIIKNTIRLVEDDFSIKNIDIAEQLIEDIRLNGNATEFSNVILSILLNSKNVLIDNEIKKPKVSIFMGINNQKILEITIRDNAQGIKIKPTKSVYSLKANHEESESSYIDIAKHIIENKFAGKIRIFSDNEGIVFKIQLPFE